jgi:hypothetical protein
LERPDFVLIALMVVEEFKTIGDVYGLELVVGVVPSRV